MTCRFLSFVSVALLVGLVCFTSCKKEEQVVATFTASMEAAGKRGLLLIDRWGQPDSIRAELRRLHAGEKLEGADLGKRIINVIEGVHEDVHVFRGVPGEPSCGRLDQAAGCGRAGE